MGASSRATKPAAKKASSSHSRPAPPTPPGAPRGGAKDGARAAIEAKPSPARARTRPLEGAEAIKAVLLGATPKARELAETLRRLVKKAAPDAREHADAGAGEIIFEKRKAFCAIAPGDEQVVLTFHRGSDLDDPESILAGNGKGARHIRVAQVHDIRGGAFERFVRQAKEIASK